MKSEEIANMNLLDEEGPEITYHFVKSEDDKFHFMAMEDDKVYGHAQAALVKDVEGLVSLENIIIDEAIRGVGIGSGLLDFVESTVQNAGFAGVFARATGGDTELYPINSFFLEAGYMCTGYSSHISTYVVEEILNSRFNEIMEKLSGDNSVKRLGEISPNTLKAISKKEGIFPNKITGANKNISRVVVSNGVPTAIVICEKEEDTLCVSDIMVLSENKDKGVLMHILNAIVTEAESQGLKEIAIRSVDGHIEEGLLRCMVFPKDKVYEQEFVKVF